MSEESPRRIGRSILAVFAGAFTGVILSVGTDALMHAIGVFPPSGKVMTGPLFLLATAYRTVYSVAGSYITARLAPYRPMMHAMVLGCIGLVVCIMGVVAAWNKVSEFGPRWYPVALTLLALPQSWLGAKIRELQLRQTA